MQEMQVQVAQEGQMIIPQEIRDVLGINGGDYVDCDLCRAVFC